MLLQVGHRTITVMLVAVEAVLEASLYLFMHCLKEIPFPFLLALVRKLKTTNQRK